MVYAGGKNGMGVYQRIINLMPPHQRYIEPFLGSGSILRNKRRAATTIGVDLDPEAILLCQSLIDVRAGEHSVQFIEGDALKLLGTASLAIFGKDTLIYCDPPYVHSTRTGGDLYKHEMNDDDHRRLLTILLSTDSMVMISGYRCALYNNALSDWNSIDYQTQTRRGMRTETLWFNFEAPTELHDYSHLGENFRERERIKRKKNRWAKRWANMDRLERQAVLLAIEEAG